MHLRHAFQVSLFERERTKEMYFTLSGRALPCPGMRSPVYRSSLPSVPDFSVLSSQTLNSIIKAFSIRLKYSLFQEINQLHLYGARPLAGHDIYPAI